MRKLFVISILLFAALGLSAETIVTGAPTNLLTTQSGTISATLNWTNSTWKAPSAGWYRMTLSATVMTVGGAGTVKATAACGSGGVNVDGVTQNLTGLRTSSTATVVCKMAAGDQFPFLITISGASGSPSVDWKLWIEKQP